MNNSKCFCAFVLALVLGSTSVCAQQNTATSNDEKIILYNSQPVKVELAEGKIVSFIGEVPSSYMNGYDLKESKEAKLKTVAIKNEELKEEITTNAGYAILSNDRVLLDYKPGFATLDKKIINKLDEIASLLKSEPATKVLLTSHLAEKGSKQSKLSDNRLEASTAYLKIKGISLDRIQSQTQHASNLLDVIVVNYLR